MQFQIPHRLFPDEHPSVTRLVQLVLCDDEWAHIDAYRMAYEHVYGIKLGEHEAEALIHRRAAIRQRLTSFPASRASVHDLDSPYGFAAFDKPIDRGVIGHPLSHKFTNLSLGDRDPAGHDPIVGASYPKASAERPRIRRASTSTSGVSVVVPCKKISTPPDSREVVTEDSLATPVSSSSESVIGPSSFPALQGREYKNWGRLDDPDSVWNNLHVERPKFQERRKFSSYREYKKTRNQPMKDNDRLFKKRVKQSFAKEEMEVLGADEVEGVGGDGDEVSTREMGEPKRQILLVKRKGNLAGQNL